MFLSADKSAARPSARVLLRFTLRTAILAVFASFGSIGFGRSFAALLWMTIILCAALAAVRRERVLTSELNHWDEMIAYTALYCGVIALDQLAGA